MMDTVQENRVKLVSLEPFRLVNSTFPKTAEVQEYKDRGKKVFGWLCTYVPEEIIHAAGALPVRVTGYNQEMELEDGNAYMYIQNCSFTRSCLQLALRGGYEYLDGVIAGSTCDGVRRLFDLWGTYVGTPFRHILTVPRKMTERAHELYYRQVADFKKLFETHLGVPISDEALRRSVAVINKSRQLLKELYEWRKLDNPPISGAETLEVLNASFRMSKEQFNECLAGLLQEISKTNRTYQLRARLMIAGSIMNNAEFIGSIEELGGLVVADELCTSTRYWTDPVVIGDGEDPVKAIARRYLNNFPCARMYPSEERFNRIVKMASDFRVEGVVSQIIRYCVTYAHDQPLLIQRLKSEGVPVLSLDVEYGTSGSGQIRTRIQAFLEMLEAKRK